MLSNSMRCNNMVKTLVDEKPFWKSKTFWLSLIQIVIGVLTYIQGQVNAGSAITLFGVLQVVMRFLTKQPISIK